MLLSLYYRPSLQEFAKLIKENSTIGSTIGMVQFKNKNIPLPLAQLHPFRLPGLLLVDEETGIILCGIDISRHIPMGQNVNQAFDKAVGCARLGIPYLSMFPFSAFVHREDGTISIENASRHFFYAFKRLRELHRSIAVAIPWPGTEGSGAPTIDVIPPVPKEDARETEDLLAMVDSLAEMYRNNRWPPLSLPIAETISTFTDTLGEPPPIPSTLDAYKVIKTDDLASYLNNFFLLDKTSLGWLPASLLERPETVITPNDSKSFRADPYAGTMLVYDYALCRTGYGFTHRERNIIPHFKTIKTSYVLNLMRNAPLRIFRRGPITFVSPDGPTTDVLMSMPSSIRQLAVAADAVILADGIIVPERFFVPAKNIHYSISKRDTRLIIFIEGKEARVLDAFAKALGYPTLTDHPKIEIRTMGGGDDVSFVKAAVRTIRKIEGMSVPIFVLRDRDYKSEVEHEEFVAKLRSEGIHVHIWSRKEVENYLLIPDVISKAIASIIPSNVTPLTTEQVRDILQELAGSYKYYVESRLLYYEMLTNRNDPEAFRKLPLRYEQLIKMFEEKWSTFDGRMSLAPGKEVLSDLFGFIQRKYKVSLSPGRILSFITRDSIDSEVERLISNIFRIVD